MIRYREGTLIPSAQINIDDTSCSIVGMADIHVGDEEFDESLFREYVQWILGDKNRYGIFLGDSYNLYSHWFVPEGMWVQTLTPRQQHSFLKSTCRGLKGKILAKVIGNHEYKGLAGKTSIDLIEELCEISGAVYLGPGGYFILDVIHPEGVTEFTFMLTHSIGGSRRKAYKPIQIVESMGFDDADIVMLGHQHTMINIPFTRLRNLNRKYHFKRIDAVRCGTMLNYPEYAVYKGLPPMQLGFPIIDLHVDQKGVSVDIGNQNLRFR